MALSEKWKLSVFEYHVDSFIVPLLFFIAISLAPVVWWKMALGFFFWSLTEYCLHRFLFHHHFRRDHWAHHVHPQAYIGISGVYVAALSAVMLAPAFLLRMTFLYGGFMLGYFTYLLLHYIMHRPSSRFYRLVRVLASNHDIHHQKGIEKNFGVTSPLWDVVFRTYVNPNHR